MKDSKISVFHYRKEFPIILLYQLISKSIALGVLLLFRELTGILLWSMDKPLITGGNLPYLLRSPEGWLLGGVAFTALVVVVYFDTCLMILISDAIVRQQPVDIRLFIKQTIDARKHFRGIRGVLAVIYNSVMTPLSLGIVGICVTTGYAIPEFIMSVINRSWQLRTAYIAFLLVMAVAGICFVFTFHAILLKGDDAQVAFSISFHMLRKNIRNFLWRYFRFFLISTFIGLIGVTMLFLIPTVLLRKIVLPEQLYSAGIILETWFTSAFLVIGGLMFAALCILKLTLLYTVYEQNEEKHVVLPRQEGRWDRAMTSVIAGFVVVSLISALFLGNDFDKYFPVVENINLISHRAGGTLANENSLLGLKRSIHRGINAAEIDVQRTLDGHYIINHDATFLRTCHRNRKPCDMMLEDIEKYRVHNMYNPLGYTTPVATLEEMLDEAKGQIELYIELKGVTADALMAQDIYQMAAERDMLDQCIFVSMDYNLIDYLETVHSDARTGYICYFSFANTERMNCDALLIEAETATPGNIARIHEEGKEVNVWTVNGVSAMITFMLGDADGLITDSVAAAQRTRNLLFSRSDEIRVLRRLIG